FATDVEGFEFFQTLQTRANRAEIGERAAQPAFRTVGHAAAFSSLTHGINSLTLRPDKENQAALRGDLVQVLLGTHETTNGLFQVDNVYVVAFPVDIRTHFRVPLAGLVTEMDAGF